MRHATLVISHLEDRRSPLVPPIDDIETGTVMFINASYSNITLKHFQELLTTQLIGEYCSSKKVGLHFPAKKQNTNSERKRGICVAFIGKGTIATTPSGSAMNVEHGYATQAL